MGTSTASIALEPVVTGLNFPTTATFGPDGALFITETGLPFGGAPAGGRVLRVCGDETEVLIDKLPPPVNGVAYRDGYLYVSVGGQPAEIFRIPATGGEKETLLTGFVGPGNYQLNMVAFGPDDKMYFTTGAMSNLGIAGLDGFDLGWLRQLPHAVDVPGYDIELSGQWVETTDPTNPGHTTKTGAFAQWGEVLPAGTRIPGQLPCTSAVMRANPDGSELELVAWGVRNGFGLLFLPDGRLICTDQGSDDRGSRPIGDAPELLFEIVKGQWYGWPDFIGDVPVTEDRFIPQSGERLQFVLQNHDELPAPQKALLEIEVHSAACKMANTPDGKIVVALFGDEVPMTAPFGPKAGRRIGLIDPDGWTIDYIGVPEGVHRPIDVNYGPDGSLYVLDFGHFDPGRGGPTQATPGSGGVWKATTAL
jgi:glucose/arabinose dehydrogenase